VTWPSALNVSHDEPSDLSHPFKIVPLAGGTAVQTILPVAFTPDASPRRTVRHVHDASYPDRRHAIGRVIVVRRDESGIAPVEAARIVRSRRPGLPVARLKT
jgi:hypothetical protein